VTRDTHGFAMKATSDLVEGTRREIFKDPKTDSGLKKSAKGLLRVELEGDNYVLYDQQSEEETKGSLELGYKDGKLLVEHSFQEIRDRLKV